MHNKCGGQFYGFMVQSRFYFERSAGYQLDMSGNNLRVTIGLVNPKTPENVGSILRACGNYRADKVLFTGNRYVKAMQYNTDTKNVVENIPLERTECLLEDIPEGADIVCVELVEGAIPLPQFEHPENAYYIFGPEDGNLSQKIVDKAQSVVYIPTVGCMNLAATVNVVLYDRLAKSAEMIAGDELIRQSRDNNNRVRVRRSVET